MCQTVADRKRSERSTKLRLAGIRRVHHASDKRLDHHQYRLYITHRIVSNNINDAVLIFRCYSNIAHKTKFRSEVGNIVISTVIYRGASVVLFILCSPYVRTLVASQTTARNCQKVIFVKFSTVVVLVLLGLLFGALTIASRWRCSTSGLKNDGVLLVKLQYQTQNRQDYLLLGEVSGNIRKKSSSSSESFPIYKITSFTKTADVLIRLNSSKLVLGDFLLEKKKGSDTSVILNGHYHHHHHPHKKPLIYHLRHSKNRNPSDRHNSHYHLHNSHYDNHKKTDRFRNLRTKREYLSGFDNVLGFYREEKVRNTVATPTIINHDSTNNDNRKISNNNINNSGVKQTDYNLLRAGNTDTNNRNNFYSTDVVSESDSEINNTNVGAAPDKLNKVKNAVEIVDGDDRDVSGYDLPSAPVVPAPPSVRRNFQFESSTQRSMPPVHVSENSLSDSSVLVLVVSVVVLTVTLGLVTCVLSHYRAGAAANSHDAAQAPTTAPMLSVVSAGTAAGVGGMDRLRSRGTARELAATRERQVRVHTVHTDTTTINLPPSIALPDGEDHPFNSRLQIRDAEQEAEIYQKCIKPPPNRTVLESESPPPYRSSSAGLLGSISGSSSGSTDWSAGSGGSAPLVVRCHSMSSTSKRQPQQQQQHQQDNSSCSYVATTTSATAGGFSNTTAYTGHAGTTIGGATIAAQKTDFIQRTVKRFTGSKDRKNQPSTLQTSSNASGLSSANIPVVIVPTKPRRISEQSQSQHSQLLLLQSQNQQQQHQQQQQQNTTNTTTGRPRPNV